MKRIRPISVILTLLVVTLSATIFIMSSQPADESSNTSGTVCRIILRIFDGGFDNLSQAEKDTRIDSLQLIVRKAAHFSEYALLAVLTLLASKSFYLKTKTSAIIAVLYPLLFAVSDEVHQYFIPGRCCELRDVCIDLSGAVTGTLLTLAVIKLIRNRKRETGKS